MKTICLPLLLQNKTKHMSEMNLRLTQKYYIEREHKGAWNLSSEDEWCTVNTEL